MLKQQQSSQLQQLQVHGNVSRQGSGGSQGSGVSSGHGSSNGIAPEKPPERISSRADSSALANHQQQLQISQLADVMQQLSPSGTYNSQQPDVTQSNPPAPPLPPRITSTAASTPANGTARTLSDEQAPDYDTVYGQQAQEVEDLPDARPVSQNYDTGTYSSTGTGTGKYKVSAKIQQLLNTLKRPKKRPLPDFYVDDETDLEVAANQLDPSSPRPEGSTMIPNQGDALSVPSGKSALRIFVRVGAGDVATFNGQFCCCSASTSSGVRSRLVNYLLPSF